MPTGTVKFFNDEKGYGFISRSDAQAKALANQAKDYTPA